MLPGTVASDSDLVAELFADELGKNPESSADGRALERALLRLGAAPEGRVLVRGHGRRPRHRRCAIPTASGPCASASSIRAGCWPRRARRSTSSVPIFVRELEPGEMVVIDATGHRSVRAFPAEAIDPNLCLFEFVYFARPDAALRPERAPGPGSHGRATGRTGAGRRRPGDGRPRVGHPRRRGLRPPVGHPLRPGAGQEPLHRSDLHRPQPGDAGARRADEAQPAARQHRRASGSSWSTTRSCGAPPPGPWSPCCGRPGRPRCTCGSRRRPTAGRASTAWTPGARSELLAANLSVDEIREYLERRLARLPRRSIVWSSATGAVGRRLLRRLPHRRLPGRGAGEPEQGRARIRPGAATPFPSPRSTACSPARPRCPRRRARAEPGGTVDPARAPGEHGG